MIKTKLKLIFALLLLAALFPIAAPTTVDTICTTDCDGAHLSIAKYAVVDPLNSTQIYYQITLINDGNKTLSPVYVRYTFPPNVKYGIPPISVGTFATDELSATYAKWTLTRLSVGDVISFCFVLDTIGECPSELVDRVDVTAGYDDPWITPIYTGKQIAADNTDAIKFKWLHVDLWKYQKPENGIDLEIES